MKMSKEIAEMNEEFAATLPAHLQGKMDTGRGSEEVDADDLTIPRLQIIQALSPQKEKTDAAYIDGAEEGDAFNTATGELYKNGIFIAPVLFRKEYLIWTMERNSNNGFRGSYPTEIEAARAKAELEDGDVCEIAETHMQYCLVLDPQAKEAQEVVISMAKSQIKVSKRFNTMVRLAGGDRFNCVYKFSVVDDKSDKGEFYNWNFKKAGYIPEWAYAQAESMYEAVKSGEKKAAMGDDTPTEKEVNPIHDGSDFPGDEM